MYRTNPKTRAQQFQDRAQNRKQVNFPGEVCVDRSRVEVEVSEVNEAKRFRGHSGNEDLARSCWILSCSRH